MGISRGRRVSGGAVIRAFLLLFLTGNIAVQEEIIGLCDVLFKCFNRDLFVALEGNYIIRLPVACELPHHNHRIVAVRAKTPQNKRFFSFVPLNLLLFLGGTNQKISV